MDIALGLERSIKHLTGVMLGMDIVLFTMW